jgi:UDP-glucose 4-epimerase
MRLAILGATGFLGRNVVRHAISCGHHVVAPVRKDSLAEHCELLRSFGADVVVGGSLEESFSKGQILDESPIETLIDCSWAGVGNAFRNSRSQFDNLTRSFDNMMFIRKVGVKHYIGIGSQAEYKRVDAPLTERHDLEPTTMYGAAKVANFHLTQALAKSFDIEHTWVRVFSLYGAGDSDSWVLNSLISSLLQGRQIPLTEGDQIWDYLHVSDAARAIVLLAENQKGAGPVNLGSGTGESLRKLLQTVGAITLPGKELVFGGEPYRNDQVMHLEADISYLKSLVEWSPLINWVDGVSELVDDAKSRIGT